MSRWIKTLICCSAFLFTSFSEAHSVSNHELITRNAIDLLRHCEIDNDKKLFDLVETFVRFNIKQDNYIKKPIMWHFPNPIDSSSQEQPNVNEKKLLYRALVVAPTFEKWFHYLIEQAMLELDMEKRAPPIGSMMHFIQDMSVPAHAVPIYHPSININKDKFEQWDNFDFRPYKKNTDKVDRLIKFEGIKIEGVEICDKLTGSKEPFKILKELQEQTLHSINETKIDPNKICERTGGFFGLFGFDCDQPTTDIYWNIFWPNEGDNINEMGFGKYACGKSLLGMKGAFGEKKIKCNGKKYEIEASEYKKFAMDNLYRSIVASANLVMYYAVQDPGARITDCKQQRQWVVSKKLLRCLHKD